MGKIQSATVIEPVIWEDEYFEIRLPRRPHIDREDGGHLVIYPKRNVSFRSELSLRESESLAVFLQALEPAYIAAMRSRGLNILWINFQDNGNWSLLSRKPRHFHIHLYGRCLTERGQTPGQALMLPAPGSPIYDSNSQLSPDDIRAILSELDNNIALLSNCDESIPFPLGSIAAITS